jgi:hypothetical protein
MHISMRFVNIVHCHPVKITHLSAADFSHPSLEFSFMFWPNPTLRQALTLM